MADLTDTVETKSSFSFVEMEHSIISFWEEGDVFQKTLEATKNREPYIFYDGPPFATGLPHHGNLLQSVIKDVVPRYWTMKGRYVNRRFGWDCHGLPIEHEIDKLLGMSAQEAVKKLGVSGYNAECRGIVERCVDEWRSIVNRLGRWVDFDNDYKTMDVWFMESVWWVVKELWDRGLIYKAHKVMPVSTALQTPIANFEATSNYMDVQDPAITVLLRIKDQDASLAVWTTTPWTLPSNLAVCVGNEIDYVKVEDVDTGVFLYLAESRLESYGKNHNLDIVERLKGGDLVGWEYEPLFPYFAEEKTRGAFVVLADDYVTTDEGTGLVHQAPAFGEDDNRVLRQHNIEAFVCPVGMDGRFTEEVRDFSGEYVKDADKNIIAWLNKKGALYEQGVIQHNYPFCYRSDTPLIYRAVPSWYVRVTEIVNEMLESNETIRWVPDHIRSGRFGNWLEGAIDWAISRNRVWGTPLPIWENEVSGNRICVGSVDELESYTGVRVEDLHREFVDELTFEVDGEEGTYRRVEEILDCWFESGSMPYAQLHYPFENKDVFKQGFPADFIVEALDQTRGWFYTLTVLASALYKTPAFKNVIVTGLVMAEDGKKMSKHLKNFTAPEQLMETYGADAFRLYLINSGLVKGEDQRFSDEGVRDMARRALLPWYNSYSFLNTYASIDQWTSGDCSAPIEDRTANVLDQWVLSKLQSLKKAVAEEMEVYRLYNVVPKLFEFIADLSNWYIRLNRSRFWGEGISEDKRSAYATLYTAVRELSITMAPFAPFLSEFIYRSLQEFDGGDTGTKPESVHLCNYPVPDTRAFKPDLEDAVSRMQQIILLGRRKREEVKIGLRTPLSSLTIVHRDRDILAQIKLLEDYVRVELNVKEIRYDQQESDYINFFAKPNFPVLGKRLGKRMREFQTAINELTPDEIEEFQETGSIRIHSEDFDLNEIQVFREAKEGTNVVSDRLISIDLDCELSDELEVEGLAREVVNRIQRTRRDIGLSVSDRIAVRYSGSMRLLHALSVHGKYVAGEILAVEFIEGEGAAHTIEVEDMQLFFEINKVDRD